MSPYGLNFNAHGSDDVCFRLPSVMFEKIIEHFDIDFSKKGGDRWILIPEDARRYKFILHSRGYVRFILFGGNDASFRLELTRDFNFLPGDLLEELFELIAKKIKPVDELAEDVIDPIALDGVTKGLHQSGFPSPYIKIELPDSEHRFHTITDFTYTIDRKGSDTDGKYIWAIGDLYEFEVCEGELIITPNGSGHEENYNDFRAEIHFENQLNVQIDTLSEKSAKNKKKFLIKTENHEIELRADSAVRQVSQNATEFYNGKEIVAKISKSANCEIEEDN